MYLQHLKCTKDYPAIITTYLDEDIDIVCDLQGHHFDLVLMEKKTKKQNTKEQL